MSMTSKKKV